MSEFNPNDPLESFLRKALHDLNETPPDEVWDGILVRLPKVETKKTFPFRNSGFLLIGFLLLSLLAYQEFSSQREIIALHRQVDQLILETKTQEYTSVEKISSTTDSIFEGSNPFQAEEDPHLSIGHVDAHRMLNTMPYSITGSLKSKSELNFNRPFFGTATNTKKLLNPFSDGINFSALKKESSEVLDTDRQVGVAASLNKLEEAIAELKALNYRAPLVEKIAALMSNPNEVVIDSTSTISSVISTSNNNNLAQHVEKENFAVDSLSYNADNKGHEKISSLLGKAEKQPQDFSTMVLLSLKANPLKGDPMPILDQDLIWPEIAEARIPKLPKGNWTIQGYGHLAKDSGRIKALNENKNLPRQGRINEMNTRGESFGYGLRWQYHISRKWALISGLEYQDNRYHSQHKTDLEYEDREGGDSGNTEIDPPPPPETEFTFSYNLNSFIGSSIITFDTKLKDVINEIDEDERINAEVAISHRLQYIAMPLLLERNWKNKKPLYFSVKAGVVAKCLVSHKQTISDFKFENEYMLLRGVPKLENNNDEIEAQKKMSYDYLLAAGLHYDLNRRMGISLEPRLTGLIGPKLKNDFIYTSQYAFGLNTLLYYRF